MNSKVNEKIKNTVLSLLTEADSVDCEERDRARLINQATALIREKNIADKNDIEIRIESEKNLIESDKNKNMFAVEMRKADIEAEKSKWQYEVETKRVNAEEQRNKQLADIEAEKSKFSLLSAVCTVAGVFVQAFVTAGLGIISVKALNYRFELATRKEVDEPLMTQTSRNIVQDGLKHNTRLF